MSTRQETDDGRIPPDDPRYLAVIEKRFNKRFKASPDYVCLVRSTGEVVSAVDEAAREERRLVVTSGGHCLEGFVSDAEVRVIVDVSAMSPSKPCNDNSEHPLHRANGNRGFRILSGGCAESEMLGDVLPSFNES